MQNLLAEGDFVRSLARQLLGGSDAEDLAQDAWIAALRRPPAALRQPRAWFARVVARLASNRRRTDLRRAARESDVAAARPVETPSTAEILACEQARQRVVAAVLALDEPFRGTVLARFYECLDSHAIAARDGVNVATVRSRLKRGLDRLRARLDAEHDGQRAAWAAPLGLLGHDPAAAAVSAGALMSTSKKAAVAGALVLFASVVAWASGAFAPEAAPPGVRAAASDAAFVAEPRGDERRDEVERTSSATGTAAFGAPREPLLYPVRDEPLDDVVVRVFDRETRQPVAGAEVVFRPFVVDLLHPQVRADRVLSELIGSDAFIERFGSRRRTDDDGCAVIRLPRSGAEVIASHGGRWVRTEVTPSTLLPGERAALWLDDSRWIRLRLVDEASGASVAGGLVEVSSLGTSPVVAASCGYGGRAGPSDADGMIRMAWARDRASIRVRPFTVGLAEWVPVELPAALERVVEVRCPATGSMTVELRTPSGDFWPGPIDARISSGRSSSDGPWAWRQTEPGVFRIPHVELGLTWKVRVHPEHYWATDLTTVVTGPRAAGEDVLVTLRTAAEPCVVRARLRLADGSLPPSNVKATVEQPGAADPTRTWSYLDEPGGIAWTVDPSVPAAGSVAIRDLWSGPLRWQGTWHLDAPPAPGVHEVGTLTLAEPALVVAGEVDVGAGPWPGGLLSILCDQQAKDGNFWGLAEVTVDPAHTRSFAVRGLTDAEHVRLRLRVDRRVLPSPPIVVPAGARDVRLVVGSGLPLRVRVLAPAAYARAVACRALREDGAQLPPATPSSSAEELSRSDGMLVDFDGRAATFSWPALPAGTYRVEVLAPGIAAPLVVVSGVRLGVGAPADPRLDPIDARERARTLTVAVDLPSSGRRPISEGGVLAFPSGRSERTLHGMLFDARGEAELLVGRDPVDVLVAVPGFRLWQARMVTESSLRVQLEPCVHARVRLAPRVAGSFAGHRIEVILKPSYRGEADQAVRFLRAGEQEPVVQANRSSLQCLVDGGRAMLDDPSAAATIPVSEPGRFEVSLLIDGNVTVDESWNHWLKSPLQPSEVEVRGEDDPVIALDVDAKVLPKVVEALSRKR